ncbi:hypothetical protein ACWD6L_29620 [Micromonospora profundi]|nr:hypothetical protein [Micromonospora sp. NRRL B-16802]
MSERRTRMSVTVEVVRDRAQRVNPRRSTAVADAAAERSGVVA